MKGRIMTICFLLTGGLLLVVPLPPKCPKVNFLCKES